MGFLQDLMTGGNTLSDQDIASDMLKDSKFAILSLAMAITEITNPEIRTTLNNQLIGAVTMHNRLSDLLVHKEWYKPFMIPQDQLGLDVNMSQDINRQA